MLRHIANSGLRRRLLPCWLLAATAVFLWVVNKHYPIEHWLFFVYAEAWGWTLLFCAASLVAGWRLLTWLQPGTARLHERVALAFALGVLVFYLGMFVCGIARLYGRSCFFALPLAMLLIGASKALSDGYRYHRKLKRFGARLVAPRHWAEVLGALLLAYSVLALYLPVLIPENIAYDSCWYHLPIAEDYAAYGGIRKFQEGWYVGAYPQLSSILYTWAFLAPGSLYQHLVLCSHLEFVLFVAGLLSTSVLAERLLEHRLKLRLPYAAAATFLFTGIFVHDSNLATNADHILGFWVAPIAVSVIGFADRYHWRQACVSGALVGAAVCTKLQGVYCLIPSALVVAVVALRRLKFKPAMVWVAACVAVASTTWVKNLVYYHDPYYPLFRNLLPSTPTFDGAGALIRKFFWSPAYLPKGNGFWERLGYALKTSVTFSFIPDGVDSFPGDLWPGFGSLYTLVTLPVLLLLRAPRRLWVLAGCIEVAFLIWYLSSHQERYLQALLPVFAASTAAALILAWRAGVWTRTGVVIIVVAQLVWGADTYFRPYHAMSGDAPIRTVSAHLGAAYKNKNRKDYNFDERLNYAEPYRKIHDVLPTDARVLLHYFHLKLGLGSQTVTDGPGWQGAIEYLIDDSPNATVAAWRKVGVTHVLWKPHRDRMAPEDIARELVLMRSLRQYTSHLTSVDGWELQTLKPQPSSPDAAATPTKIAWLTCDSNIPAGIYTPEGLMLHKPLNSIAMDSTTGGGHGNLLQEANAVALSSTCSEATAYLADARQDFALMGTADTVTLMVRD